MSTISPKVGDYIMFHSDTGYKICKVVIDCNSGYNILHIVDGIISKSCLLIIPEDRYATPIEIMEAKLLYGL